MTIISNPNFTTPDGQPLGQVVASPNYLDVILSRRGSTDPMWDQWPGGLFTKVESGLIELFAEDWPDNVERRPVGSSGFRVKLAPITRYNYLAAFVEDAYNLAISKLDPRTDRDVIVRVEGVIVVAGSFFGPAVTSNVVMTNA